MIVPSILARLKSLVPAGWASRDAAPVFGVLLGGIADALEWIRERLDYTKAQTRLGTTSGFWLDLTAWDFFAERLMRRRAEQDDPFRTRILRELFRPRATRAALVQAVQDLTGRTPTVVELWNTGDCGAYDNGTMAYAGESSGTGPLAGAETALGGYDAGMLAYVTPTGKTAGGAGAGLWGSYDFNNQVFVTAYRGTLDLPDLSGRGAYDTGVFAYGGGEPGTPAFIGLDTASAGYDSGRLAFITPNPPYGSFPGSGYYGEDDALSAVSDAELYAVIAGTVAAGVTAWTVIRS
jgi:hypothetical protein